MATLYLLNDLSCALPWNLAAIHANKDKLAESGMDFGPFPHMGMALLPMHSQFWFPFPVDKPIPAARKLILDEVCKKLDEDRDILLLNSSIDAPSYQSLGRLLSCLPPRHKVASIFVLGSPVCVFEQRWRTPYTIPEARQIPLARGFASLGSLIENDRQFYGGDNVRLLADLSCNPKALPDAATLKKIFLTLGHKEYAASEATPPHPFIFGSNAARRLFYARWLRMNAWPPLDEDKFRKVLLTCDAQWDNSPISPRHLRQMVYEEGKEDLAKLESVMGLPKGSLNPPSWLLEKERNDHPPADMEKARIFINALPADVAWPLARRLGADPSLRVSPHEGLFQALAERPEECFRHLGEPVPPVEMTILTMAYNQEKFIAQCMDSVLAQKTDFPVRHLVLDHCSRDDTPKIIAAYAEKHPSISPVLLATHWPTEHVRGLFMRCKSKYAALCDGDDYFTDPLKLRKQVDFLEKHQRCALVFHPVQVDFEHNKEKNFIYPPLENLPRGVKEEYYLADLFKSNFIQTNSVVYRWRFADGVPAWFRPDLCPSDWYWHLLHAETGKIGFIPEVMSVYRRHDSALYKEGFKDAKAHRKSHGMAELRTYQAVDEHFQGRYFRDLAALANGVFTNFLEVSIDGDNSLLDQACENYPKFGANFLKNLKLGGRRKSC